MRTSARLAAVVAVLAVVAGTAYKWADRLEKPALPALQPDRDTLLPQASSAGPIEARPLPVKASLGSQRLEPTLRQLATQLDLYVQVHPGIADDLVGGPRPDEGPADHLQRLLRPYDTFYLHSADAGLPARPTAVWVLPRGTAQRRPPVAVDSPADAPDLQHQIHSGDVAARVLGYESLLEQQGVDGAETLQQALNDSSDEVRSSALFAATVAGVPLPTGQLQTLVVNDSSPAVRRAALNAASDRADAGAIATYALSDPDPEIRRIAQALVHRGSADPDSGAADSGPQQPDESSMQP